MDRWADKVLRAMSRELFFFFFAFDCNRNLMVIADTITRTCGVYIEMLCGLAVG